MSKERDEEPAPKKEEKKKGGNSFLGSDIEFEYGATGWWTTEFYLDGQATANDSTIFTGFRWENRFRPLPGEHWINPVIYIEFENTSADKALREVVGHDGKGDFDSQGTSPYSRSSLRRVHAQRLRRAARVAAARHQYGLNRLSCQL